MSFGGYSFGGGSNLPDGQSGDILRHDGSAFQSSPLLVYAAEFDRLLKGRELVLTDADADNERSNDLDFILRGDDLPEFDVIVLDITKSSSSLTLGFQLYDFERPLPVIVRSIDPAVNWLYIYSWDLDEPYSFEPGSGEPAPYGGMINLPRAAMRGGYPAISGVLFQDFSLPASNGPTGIPFESNYDWNGGNAMIDIGFPGEIRYFDLPDFPDMLDIHANVRITGASGAVSLTLEGYDPFEDAWFVFARHDVANASSDQWLAVSMENLITFAPEFHLRIDAPSGGTVKGMDQNGPMLGEGSNVSIVAYPNS